MLIRINTVYKRIGKSVILGCKKAQIKALIDVSHGCEIVEETKF